MAEKDEEFAATKNINKGIGKMQSLIFLVVTEALVKSESLRMKKKLKTDVLDLESNLECASAANVDTQRSIKNYKLHPAEGGLGQARGAAKIKGVRP